MTFIQNTHSHIPVATIDDVRHLYRGTENSSFEENQTPRIGMEIEYAFYDVHTVKPITSQQSNALIKNAADCGLYLHNEPSAASLEIPSAPFLPNDINILQNKIDTLFQTLIDQAKHTSCLPSPFGHIANATGIDHSVVDNERYQTFFNPYRDDMADVFEFFTTCVNIQTSISYKNSDHLLRIIRLCVALEPILFLLTDTSMGFVPCFTGTHNLAHKDKLGRNSGIPDFYLTSKTGNELIENHINFTLNEPYMFAYFNQDGDLTKLPSGQWGRFSDLEKENLGPQNLTNYLQAQSESWRRACNIATIVDGNDQVVGHRAEIGVFQTGLMHQRHSALALSYLIGFSDAFYEGCKTFLLQNGIDLDNLIDAKPLLDQNFKAACYHDNNYENINFANTSAADFAKKLIGLAEKCLEAEKPELLSNIQPLKHIINTNQPDWKIFRDELKDKDSTENFLKAFAEIMSETPDFIDPTSCASWAFEKLKTANSKFFLKSA